MKILVILLVSNFCFAFKLVPLSQSIILGQNSNTAVFQIQNKNTQPVAIEVSLKSREMEPTGKEIRRDVDKNQFLLYPQQIILKPGQKRGVKVKWLGGDVDFEQSYRVIVEQLPLDFKKEKQTGISLLLKYVGALYVTKSGYKENIKLHDVVKDNGHLIFKTSNLGKSHKVLKKLIVTFTKKDKTKIKLVGDQLSGFDGENLLANSKRNFKVKMPKVFEGIDLNSGKFSFIYE